MATDSTHISYHVKAPRAKVYAALISTEAITKWKVPDGMSMQVHEFDGRENGTYRISLTYDSPAQAGKTTEHTDTYHGHFVQLVPNEKVVEEDEFETSDPSLQGKMTATITLLDAEDGGTNINALHEGLPPGVSATDNQIGWQMALAKLATLVEG
jgi:uncharacterized protein YndB with AHSA1/START domain